MPTRDSDASTRARQVRVHDSEHGEWHDNEYRLAAATTGRPPGPTRMLRLKQVMERTELRKTTIYKLQKQGRFPRSVPMTNRSVRWIESEVEEYLASRARARGRPNIDSSGTRERR
jgi:prophage regulatory protein